MRLGLPLLFSLLLASAAEASLVVPHTVESLDQEADLVVRARIGRSWSKWDRAHRRIWTYTEVEVLEDLRGSQTAPEVLTLQRVGGSVGDVSMQVSGSPVLQPDDEFVLFLRAATTGRYAIVGLSQGAFRIQRDADLVLAVPLLEGLAFVPLRSEQLGQTRLVQMALDALREALNPSAEQAPQVPTVPVTPSVPAVPPSPTTAPPQRPGPNEP